MATATDGEEEDFMEDQDGQERIRLLARQVRKANPGEGSVEA